MKRFLAALLLVPSASFVAHAEQLIPAGSVVQCMVSEPHLSSKTEHVGDPVLCQMSHSEMYGRSVFPYGAYLVGRFEDYKDPGHFVGKGWMELKFDRMVVGNDTVIPISTRVVATSGKNPVDKDGKIHGTGHAVRDTVEWMIPVLWPIDLINLPRRGPYPELKAETRLTVLMLNDFGIPTKNEVQKQPEMISKYNYADNEPQQQAAAPIERAYPQQMAAPVQQSYAQPYAQPSPTVVVVQAPAPTIIQQAAPQPAVYAYPPVAYAYPAPPPPVAYAYPPGYGYPPVAYRGYYRPYGR
ncbi:hypothetical protein EDE15_0448 [Edaphobacter aggregans]|uniref:Uncharacterized protein n=1 Tax=Edaphobacter aggregans TaxID=570835 RepID=A0A428MDM8_9BACT|nr:hypothetical protein [Edaphobacter aggregans]RSL14978.1 hypothetical protein EDE15_0448 [Edaphobacter aggregans]